MPRAGTTRRVRGGGFSLVEAVVASGAAGVLLAALGSVLSIASRAMPGAHDAVSDASTARRALLNMASEIGEATKVITAKPTTLEFEVADRDADGKAETVKYSWTGVKGDPLVRSCGGIDTTVVGGVTSLALTYTTQAGTIVGDPVSTESAEQLLAWYHADTDNKTDLNSTRGDGQAFFPRLPENATAWKVTRVKLWAYQNSSLQTGTVDVVAIGSDFIPTARVVGSTNISESSMPVSAGWFAVAFASPGSLGANEGAAILVKDVSGGDVGRWSYMSKEVPSISTAFLSPSGSTSWNVSPMRSYKFEAYGTYTAPVTSSTACQRLTAVQIAVQCAGLQGTLQISASAPGGAVMP